MLITSVCSLIPGPWTSVQETAHLSSTTHRRTVMSAARHGVSGSCSVMVQAPSSSSLSHFSSLIPKSSRELERKREAELQQSRVLINRNPSHTSELADSRKDWWGSYILDSLQFTPFWSSQVVVCYLPAHECTFTLPPPQPPPLTSMPFCRYLMCHSDSTTAQGCDKYTTHFKVKIRGRHQFSCFFIFLNLCAVTFSPILQFRLSHTSSAVLISSPFAVVIQFFVGFHLVLSTGGTLGSIFIEISL